MGIMVGLPSPSGSEKDLQLNFGKNMTVQVEMRAPHLPAEWHLQSGIQLTWPHAGTDWAYMLKEVQECFVNIAREIAKRELLLIVTPEPEEVKKQIVATVNMDNVRFLRCETNDTWARDHGAITMIDTGNPSLLDFTFNGWGLKFASELDNLITGQAVKAGALKGQYIDCLDFVLEGGSIESDGRNRYNLSCLKNKFPGCLSGGHWATRPSKLSRELHASSVLLSETVTLKLADNQSEPENRSGLL